MHDQQHAADLRLALFVHRLMFVKFRAREPVTTETL